MPETRKGDQPAFPTESATQYWHGMSLRDWFAGQAMAGFAASAANEALPMEADEGVDEAMARFWATKAKVAYIIADAMLAAREARS